MNVFIDHRYGTSKKALKIKRQTSWYARQVFDVTPEHHLYVGSLDDLVAQLRKYTTIEKLIFFPHGIFGAFLLGGKVGSIVCSGPTFRVSREQRRLAVMSRAHIESAPLCC